jgi:hypothetical protein
MAEIQSPGKGGMRAGPGRPPGSTTKPELDAAPGYNYSDIIVNDGKKRTPLEFMLDVMNDPAVNFRMRTNMALGAASFCHPRISEHRLGKKEAEKAKMAEQPRFYMPVIPKQPTDNPAYAV